MKRGDERKRKEEKIGKESGGRRKEKRGGEREWRKRQTEKYYTI